MPPLSLLLPAAQLAALSSYEAERIAGLGPRHF